MPRRRKEMHGDRLVTCYAERHATVHDMLACRFAQAADEIAVVDGEVRLSYAQMARRSAAVAAQLASAGVIGGERVAVMLENGLDALLSVIAIVRLGAVIVPVGTRLRAPEIAYILADTAPVVIIHGPAFAAELALVGAAACILMDVSQAGWGAAVPDAAPPPALRGEDDLFGILYTSGTTGTPKGAMLTHLNVVHSCMHWQEVHGLHQGERTLLCVPWSHVAGLCGVLLPFLHIGGTVVMMAEFKRRHFLELAQRERITHALMVPAMYGLCLLESDLAAFDLSSWRIGAYGSAPMPEPTIARFARAFPHLQMCNCYGATETCSPATIMPLGDGVARLDSVGHAVPCGEIRVMDEAGREVPPGAEGEIWIAGPMVVPGYWRRPAADADAFAGGYWKSGDVGSVDADGYVRVVDRKKDMINRGGFKVYPAEVERALAGLDGVVEAAIVGRPDTMLGEAVVAFLCVTDGDLTAEHVRGWCATRMADYKVPLQVVISRDALPRNANGKLQKAELRMAAARHAT